MDNPPSPGGTRTRVQQRQREQREDSPPPGDKSGSTSSSADGEATKTSSPATATPSSALRSTAEGGAVLRDKTLPPPPPVPFAGLGQAATSAPSAAPAAAVSGTTRGKRTLRTLAQTVGAAAAAVASSDRPPDGLDPSIGVLWSSLTFEQRVSVTSDAAREQSLAHACAAAAAAEKEAARHAAELEAQAFRDEQRPLTARLSILDSSRATRGAAILAEQAAVEELLANLLASELRISGHLEVLARERTEEHDALRSLSASKARQESSCRDRAVNAVGGPAARTRPPAPTAAGTPVPVRASARASAPEADLPSQQVVRPDARLTAASATAPPPARSSQSWAVAAGSPVTRSDDRSSAPRASDEVFLPALLHTVAQVPQFNFRQEDSDALMLAATNVAFVMDPAATVASAVAASATGTADLRQKVEELLRAFRKAHDRCRFPVTWSHEPSAPVAAAPTPEEAYTIPKREVKRLAKVAKTHGGGGHHSSSSSANSRRRTVDQQRPPPSSSAGSGAGSGASSGSRAAPRRQQSTNSGTRRGGGGGGRTGRSRAASRSDPESVSDHSLPRKKAPRNRSNDD